VVITAVLVWNLAQHAIAGEGRASSPAPLSSAAAPPAARKGAVTLAAAKPAPPESDVPRPYITPGLAPAVAIDAQAPPQPIEAVFLPKGAVYGVSPAQSPVMLQARKPASIIVRGADGAIYFARQLAAGESYRAPVLVKGLVIDVSDPQAFDIFMNGAPHGQLQANQTPVAKLVG